MDIRDFSKYAKRSLKAMEVLPVILWDFEDGSMVSVLAEECTLSAELYIDVEFMLRRLAEIAPR